MFLSSALINIAQDFFIDSETVRKQIRLKFQSVFLFWLTHQLVASMELCCKLPVIDLCFVEENHSLAPKWMFVVEFLDFIIDFVSYLVGSLTM